MDSIDIGDEVTGRRRRTVEPEGVEDTEGHVVSRRGDDADRRRPPMRNAPDEGEDTEGHVAGSPVSDRRRPPVKGAGDELEDTEGHAFRTYPSVSPDEPAECRSPLPGDEEDRRGRI